MRSFFLSGFPASSMPTPGPARGKRLLSRTPVSRCLVLLLPLICLFSLPGAYASAKSEGPLSALTLAQQSVDQADSDLFHQAVDMDSVLNSASGTLMENLRQQAASGNLGNSNIAMLLAVAGMAENSGQGDFIKQMLVSEVKGFVVSGINGGYFAGKPNGRVKPPSASLASTLEKMPEGRREIMPGSVLSNDGSRATVSGVFVDPGAGRLPLTLALELQGGQWRVVEISNAAELFAKAARRDR